MSYATMAARAAIAAGLAALVVGCQAPGSRSGAPASTPTATGPTTPTAAVSPSATPSPVTAANTVQVCQAVDRLIIATSRRIAADSTAATERELTGEQLADQLRGNLAELADQIRSQARRAEDPQIKKLVADTADQIDAGGRAERPAAWLADTFTRIPANLTRDCRP
ncbi:hypothetical protein AB0C04_03670 [Micromonospora sp. NPDC048909]|uniref:hypothetical protein n=1 Tax=Micromonospora sp. NPDC048909 TaxID=3155643 RepID=UPI0033C55D6B